MSSKLSKQTVDLALLGLERLRASAELGWSWHPIQPQFKYVVAISKAMDELVILQKEYDNVKLS